MVGVSVKVSICVIAVFALSIVTGDVMACDNDELAFEFTQQNEQGE